MKVQLTLALLFAATLAGPAVAAEGPLASGDPARQIAWERDLDEALARSAAERRPLFVAVNMDGESACERIVRETYRDPAFVALTRRAVCVVASAFRHSPRDVDDDGRRIPCPRLGRVTCGEHIALEPILFDRFLGGERIAPRHALVTPEGRKRFDLFLQFDLGVVDRTLARELAPWPEPSPATAPLQPFAPRPFDSWRRILARAKQPEIADVVVRLAREGDFSDRAGAAVWGRLRRIGQVPGSTRPEAALRTALAHLDGDAASARTLLIASAVLVPGDGGRARPGGPRVDRDLEHVLGLAVGDGPAAAEDARVIRALSFDSDRLLRAAARLRTAGEIWPKASDPPQDETALLAELDAGLADLHRADPRADLRVGLASLELAKLKIDAALEGGHLYLADAERFLERAASRIMDDPTIWVARAKAAYYHGRHEDQEAFARRALEMTPMTPQERTLRAIAGLDIRSVGRIGLEPPPDPAGLEGASMEGSDVRHEALRFLGDAAARLVTSRTGGDPVVEALGVAVGGEALLLAAAGGRADEVDWLSASSFLGSVGLAGAEIAWLDEGIRRFPESNDLRQAMTRALWRAGRPELIARHAERIVALHPADGVSTWYLGYARILGAEQLRREERPEAALKEYRLAELAFAGCAEQRPDFEASCRWYHAFVARSRGFAHLLVDRQREAAECLLEAVRLDRSVAWTAAGDAVRDGVDRDVLDLVDACLEWRARGPSPVDPRRLLRELEAAVADDLPMKARFALAIADSELREALRAEGRGDMDAFDRYMDASMRAARRARELQDDEDSRRQFCQSSVVFAEGLLARDQVPRARELLYFAAQLMEADPPGHSDGAERVTPLAALLRERLGERRPLDRPGR